MSCGLINVSPAIAARTASMSRVGPRWRYGMLGWRRGPEYAAVVDERGARPTHLTVDLSMLTPLFGGDLDRPAPASTVDGDVLDELTAAGVVAVFAGRAVCLPYRLRLWPVNGVW